MISWNNRPTISANLLNPAFCGEILRRCIQSYQNESSTIKFPYPLIFLILPIVLHQQTRNALPRSTRKSFFEWVEENEHLKINFAKRANSLIPYTREAFSFLLQYNAMEVLKNGELSVKEYKKRKLADESTEEIEEIFRKASFLGKWFSMSGNTRTIFTVLGIRP